MKRVDTAIEKGRCVIAIAGSLLKSAEIMLALSDRSVVPSIALSGPAVTPVRPPTQDAVAAALQPGGVLVLVDPQLADMPAVKTLAEHANRSAHKPEVVVVAKSYSPFLLGGSFSGMRVTHEKGRGPSFIKDLPVPEAAEALSTFAKANEERKPKKPKKGSEAPRFVFVGRDEELGRLGEMLSTGGPVVVSGPEGVGRALLVEHAIASSGLQRLPDLTLGYGVGADTVAGRIAAVARAAGSDTLYQLLAKGGHTPRDVARVAIEALQAASAAEGQAMVVRCLDHALGREADFFRKSRLEMLLEVLLTSTYPLRLVFVSATQPVFFRETHNQTLRRFTVEGLKGRFLHEIFDAYRAPEVPRERFGPLSERICGHPMAARTFAIAVRDRKDGAELLDSDKFLVTSDLSDLRALRKELRKRVDKLKGPLRDALAVAAHFHDPVDGRLLADMGISRKDRSQLLALGLLDVVGTQEDKRYHVHRLVRSFLGLREVTDFDTLHEVARLFAERAKDAEALERFAWAQRANHAAELGRDSRGGVAIELPDDDAFLDGLHGMLRRKEPRYDLVEQQVRHVLNRCPGNADAHLLRLQAMVQARAKNDVIADAFEQALEQAPVPELFHQAATFWLHRRARAKAIQVMERAVDVLPEHSRLYTRLAALLLKQGRRPEAFEHLKKAMELDPQLPDTYGLLGMARRDEGTDALEQAEGLLREAVRLAPTDAVQISRLVGLLLDKARVAEFAVRDALREEARGLLDAAIKAGGSGPENHLQYATLLREEGGDLERAEWFLAQARKHTDRGNERRFRIGLEGALVQLARGELDAAEKRIRDLAAREPSSDRVFAALAQLLVARELYIPAHAEYLRARERTAANSLARLEYETEIVRLQALIEAQAAGLVPDREPQLAGPELHSASAFRVIRRRGADGDAPMVSKAEPASDEPIDQSGNGVEEAAPLEDPALGESTAASEQAEDEKATPPPPPTPQ